MSLTLLALSLAPGIAIAIFFYIKDKHEKEPLRAIFFSFFLGCLSVIPAILLETLFMSYFPTDNMNIPLTLINAFIFVAGAEELSKYIMFNYYFKSPNFNEPYDGIFYGVMISLGFAAVENISYVMDGGFSVGVLRMFTAVPAHAIFGAVMGYYFGLAWQDRENKTIYMLRGLVAAIILHGTYDFFLFQQNYPALGLISILGVFLCWKLVTKAINIHNDNSPHKKIS
jgi:RsiW-degrading membrane proteinase PrsW (M82 family)